MKEDLQHRLKKLAWDITALGNFNYASQYGLSRQTVHRYARGIMHDFPEISTSSDETIYPILELSPNQPSYTIDPKKLEDWERRLRSMFRRLRSDPAYKSLLKAYTQDDQEQIAELLPLVFCNLALGELIPAGSPQTPVVFHGVRVPEQMSPEAYLKFCLRLQREGLKASPYGLHIGIDQKIRPVFAAREKEGSHGLMVFSFRPTKYTVLLEGIEAKIYTKRLQTPLKLWLKDSDAVEGADMLEELGISREQAKEYSRKLEELLVAERIPFQKFFQPHNL